MGKSARALDFIAKVTGEQNQGLAYKASIVGEEVLSLMNSSSPLFGCMIRSCS